MKNINISDANCPVRRSLDLFKRKWAVLIIYQVNERIVRYGELKRSIPGISEKMLIQELNFLVEKELVNKKSYFEIPPRVEYSLTAKGKNVLPIIGQLEDFGIQNLF